MNLQTLSLKHKYTRDWEQRQDLVVKQNQILQCFANSEIVPLPCKTYLCFLESSPSCGQSPHLSKHEWENRTMVPWFTESGQTSLFGILPSLC